MDNLLVQTKMNPGENYYQYIWRLDNLIRSGNLPSWEIITPYVNKQLFEDETDYKGESAFRKSVKYARDFYEAGVFNQYLDDEFLLALKQQTKDLEIERQKLNATKVEYTRQIRQQSRFELFYQNIADKITTIDSPEFVYHEFDHNNKCIVVGISDIHYGATFKSEHNEYSREICQERFNKLLDWLIDYISTHQTNRIKIINCGDTIQGLLRLSDLQINDTTVVECVVEVSKLIAAFLNSLSAFCDIEYYHVTHANHSQTRSLGTRASELAAEDVEKIIVNYIHDVLVNNERIQVIFDINKEYLDFNIFDFQCTIEHGHRINNLNTFLRDKSNSRRKMYSYGFVGHFHNSQEIIVGEEDGHNVELLCIPSFIGSDPYSDTLNVGAKAMGKVYVFDPVYGHIETSSIILN